MKKIIALILAMLMVLSLAACGGAKEQTEPEEEKVSAPEEGSEQAQQPQKTYTLRVSGIDGGVTLFPVYLAQEKGWFADAGLEIERTGFTSGPVQMEAIDTWDVGTTGIGGVLTGTISYNAVVLSPIGTDDGNQYIFVRSDSPVAQAGAGNSEVDPEIYGSADSWRGMSVNCTYGTVGHYLLMRTIGGFGLTIDDVVVNWMDMPTANASFLAGEGDAAVLNGEVCFKEDKKDFIVAATGPMSDLGLMTNLMANSESLADPEKREAIKIFTRVFFETIEWIKANTDEAVQYLINWSAYAGNTIDEEVALRTLTVDRFFSLEENHDALHEEASDGSGLNEMQEDLVSVLRFFVECGSYQEGDDEIFLQPEHFDSTIIDELYAEAQ